MFILIIFFQHFYIHPVADWPGLCCKVFFKSRNIYLFFNLSPWVWNGFSGLPYGLSSSTSILLISSLTVIVTVFSAIVSPHWVILTLHVLTIKPWHHQGFQSCIFFFNCSFQLRKKVKNFHKIMIIFPCALLALLCRRSESINVFSLLIVTRETEPIWLSLAQYFSMIFQ